MSNELIDAVELARLCTDGTRILDLFRAAFEIHKVRLEGKDPSKGVEFMPPTALTARYKVPVWQGIKLTEDQRQAIFEELKEFLAAGEIQWACSAIDLLLDSE